MFVIVVVAREKRGTGVGVVLLLFFSFPKLGEPEGATRRIFV